jgi:hypothetical protein
MTKDLLSTEILKAVKASKGKVIIAGAAVSVTLHQE